MEEDLPGLSEVYDDHSSRTMCIRQSWNISDLGISATEKTDGVSPSVFLNARSHIIQNNNVAS
jgi:hypothetical protein